MLNHKKSVIVLLITMVMIILGLSNSISNQTMVSNISTVSNQEITNANDQKQNEVNAELLDEEVEKAAQTNVTFPVHGHRQLNENNRHSWLVWIRAVNSVNPRSVSYGSGILIAPNLVLTAAHNFVDVGEMNARLSRARESAVSEGEIINRISSNEYNYYYVPNQAILYSRGRTDLYFNTYDHETSHAAESIERFYIGEYVQAQDADGNLQTDEEGNRKSTIAFDLDRLHIYYDFSTQTFMDIAIIKLDRIVNQQPIQLPVSSVPVSEAFEDQTVTQVGFGDEVTDKNARISANDDGSIHEADFKILNYKNPAHKKTIQQTEYEGKGVYVGSESSDANWTKRGLYWSYILPALSEYNEDEPVYPYPLSAPGDSGSPIYFRQNIMGNTRDVLAATTVAVDERVNGRNNTARSSRFHQTPSIVFGIDLTIPNIWLWIYSFIQPYYAYSEVSFEAERSVYWDLQNHRSLSPEEAFLRLYGDNQIMPEAENIIPSDEEDSINLGGYCGRMTRSLDEVIHYQKYSKNLEWNPNIIEDRTPWLDLEDKLELERSTFWIDYGELGYNSWEEFKAGLKNLGVQYIFFPGAVMSISINNSRYEIRSINLIDIDYIEAYGSRTQKFVLSNYFSWIDDIELDYDQIDSEILPIANLETGIEYSDERKIVGVTHKYHIYWGKPDFYSESKSIKLEIDFGNEFYYSNSNLSSKISMKCLHKVMKLYHPNDSEQEIELQRYSNGYGGYGNINHLLKKGYGTTVKSPWITLGSVYYGEITYSNGYKKKFKNFEDFKNNSGFKYIQLPKAQIGMTTSGTDWDPDIKGVYQNYFDYNISKPIALDTLEPYGGYNNSNHHESPSISAIGGGGFSVFIPGESGTFWWALQYDDDAKNIKLIVKFKMSLSDWGAYYGIRFITAICSNDYVKAVFLNDKSDAINFIALSEVNNNLVDLPVTNQDYNNEMTDLSKPVSKKQKLALIIKLIKLNQQKQELLLNLIKNKVAQQETKLIKILKKKLQKMKQKDLEQVLVRLFSKQKT